MALTAESYLWEHWKFNADQRLKAFNLYVVFSIFANGMVFTALDKRAQPLRGQGLAHQDRRRHGPGPPH